MEPEHALDTSGQLLTQLRNATRSAHRDLEHSSLMRALMAADLSRAQYVQVLQVFASFYQQVDACFANQELAFEFFGEYQYQLRSPALEADLRKLGSELPTANALPEWRVDFNSTSGLDRQMWLLGMAYVVEGSSQGARIILPRLHKTLGLDASSGLGFFSRQLELSTQWQALLRCLTQPFSTLPGAHALLACHQFDHEWHGQVAAEATGQYLQSMRDHHFPASDIPPQARAIYSKNPFRIIGSASASPVSMQGNPQADASAAVDMSQGALRAVSPVHMQYLQNLGVAASCSIGIFKDDTLWGIIACHHTQELWLHFKVRAALTLIVQFASQRFFHLQHQAIHKFQHQVHQLRDELAQHQSSSSSFEQIFQHHMPAWLELIQADGCCYVEDTQVLHATGGVPNDQFIRDSTALLAQQAMPESYWSTRSVAEYLNDATDVNCAGLFAIPMRLSAQRLGWLLFFRPELIERRNWAGKPEKAIYKGLTGDMLGPRKSFSMWQQTVEGQSAAWTEEQLFAARDLARDLLIFTHRENL